MVQAEKFEQQQLEQTNRGRKRKASNTVVVEKATLENQLSSPEFNKPQVLLVPELLPKGMWKQQIDAPKIADKHTDQTEVEQQPGLSQSYSDNSPHSFDLGLDLGFDIAQQTAANSTNSTILEIADFLEKDIDVFTPTTIRTPRSATILDRQNRQAEVSRRDAKEQDLINEILNFSL
ncbi:hypothetical protein IWW36_005389 [Coemansia brasiliensis]|uniref:Uncharacterized protein n=1 Tax=Coemansia brasiliensis TaxID=2650707 RepID=A0A9W8LXW3_9FUNG|nr:hypothetical protein IWW36_005389 [Coemansia brasiliensis]